MAAIVLYKTLFLLQLRFLNLSTVLPLQSAKFGKRKRKQKASAQLIVGKGDPRLGSTCPGYIVFPATPVSHVGKCHRDVFQFPLPPPPRVHYANGTAVMARDHSQNEKSITSYPIKVPLFPLLSFFPAWTFSSLPPPTVSLLS